ncbi:MAG: hypothetical protein K5912_02275 [Alphaproteobacteria bacterium]|nr:hypothetical protein [Alphaproteobacteria bacterium]
MSQLIQIKGFDFIALKDDVVITPQDRKDFLSKTKDDFDRHQVDIPTSIALLNEFPICPYPGGEFHNDANVKNQALSVVNKDYVKIAPVYSFESDHVPLLLQKAGLKIKRNKNELYLVPGPSAKEPYSIVDKDNNPYEESSGNANVFLSLIQLNDTVLMLERDKYETYLRVEELINTNNYRNVADDDLYLWALVDCCVNRKDKQDIIIHELKHVKNHIMRFDAMIDNPNFKLSPIDIFKLEKNDEISARIAEAIEAVNTYNKSENKNDLSMSESTHMLQQLLYNKTVQERTALLSDIPNIVRLVCEYWYKVNDADYLKRFLYNLTGVLKYTPLKNLARTTDGVSYESLKKSMYTYNVYDQKTGKYNIVNVSDYVGNIYIDDNLSKEINGMYDKYVTDREKSIQNMGPRIQWDIIDKANKEYKKLIEETDYRKELKKLQSKGYDYNSALLLTVENIDQEKNSDTQGKIKTYKKAQKSLSASLYSALWGNIDLSNEKK